MVVGGAAVRAAFAVAIAGTPGAERVEAPPTSAPVDDDLRKFDEAEDLYERGEYAAAILLLRELLRTNSDPILYFNLGRAHESAGEPEAAIEAYECYLQGFPEASDRDAVRDRITNLRARIEAAKAPPPPVLPHEATVSPPSPPDPPPRTSPAYVPWTMLGVGAAGLVTGGILGIMARSKEREARGAAVQLDAFDAHQQAGRHALGANISFALGGALAVAGLTWGLVSTLSGQRRADGARVGARGFGVAWRF